MLSYCFCPYKHEPCTWVRVISLKPALCVNHETLHDIRWKPLHSGATSSCSSGRCLELAGWSRQEAGAKTRKPWSQMGTLEGVELRGKANSIWDWWKRKDFRGGRVRIKSWSLKAINSISWMDLAISLGSGRNMESGSGSVVGIGSGTTRKSSTKSSSC